MAKGILAVTLFKTTTVLSQQANQEAKTIKPENGCKMIAFGPIADFTVSQDNDTRLGPKRHQLIVLFNGEDTHCRNSFWGTFSTKSSVFPQGDFPNGAHILNTMFLIVITLKPNLTIGMG